MKTFDMMFTKIPILFGYFFLKWYNWSRLDCSHPVKEWSISIRWESIVPVNSWILLLSDSAWSLCFWISDLTPARICSFCLSRRRLICSLSGSRLDFRFWDKFELGSYTGFPVHVRVKKDWAGNKLSSWEWWVFLRFAGSSRSWLNNSEDSAFLTSSSSGFILEDRSMSLWVVGVVDQVGLIKCRRSCLGHTAILSFCGSSQCSLNGNVTWEVDVEEETDEGGTLICKQEDEDERACDIMGDTWRSNNLFAKTTRSWAMRVVMSNMRQLRANNCAEAQQTHYELERQTCPSQVEGQTFLLTWNRTRKLETAFILCVLVHAGNLKFRFRHGPFTKRFGPVVTRVPAVVLSISRFSRLAVTCFRFIEEIITLQLFCIICVML